MLGSVIASVVLAVMLKRGCGTMDGQRRQLPDALHKHQTHAIHSKAVNHHMNLVNHGDINQSINLIHATWPIWEQKGKWIHKIKEKIELKFNTITKYCTKLFTHCRPGTLEPKSAIGCRLELKVLWNSLSALSHYVSYTVVYAYTVYISSEPEQNLITLIYTVFWSNRAL